MFYLFSNLKYYLFAFLNKCSVLLVHSFFHHISFFLYMMLLAICFSINIAYAGTDIIPASKLEIENYLPTYSPSYEAWKYSVDLINNPNTSNPGALAVFKKNNLGFLYGSLGNDGAAIKNEISLFNIIAAQAHPFLPIPSKFISSTQTIYFEGSHVFNESYFTTDSVLLKNNIKPFICQVHYKDGSINWSLVYQMNQSEPFVVKFFNQEDINILNDLALNPEKFIIISRSFTDVQTLPIIQHALGDLLIIDQTNGDIIAMIDAKNLTKESNLLRFFNSQKNLDFYAHYQNNTRLYETFFNSNGYVHFNNEFTDTKLITSTEAYKNLLHGKRIVSPNTIPRIVSGILKFIH